MTLGYDLHLVVEVKSLKDLDKLKESITRLSKNGIHIEMTCSPRYVPYGGRRRKTTSVIILEKLNSQDAMIREKVKISKD